MRWATEHYIQFTLLASVCVSENTSKVAAVEAALSDMVSDMFTFS